MNSFTMALTNEEMEVAIKAAASHGITLSPAGGELPEAHGVTASYAVISDGQSNEVTVTVTKKPFYVSMGMIANAIKSMLGIA
jgi:hypothetical protein